MPTRVCVLTYTPSPYQVELFDAAQQTGRVEMQVLYLHTRESGRQWRERPRVHSGSVLPSAPDQQMPPESIALVQQADVFVLNYYNEPRAVKLLQARLRTGKPWAFWGERMGFRHPVLGRLARRWKLRALHASTAPIWGIGEWAVQGYRAEFGSHRKYVDLPYFSDLSRFHSPSPDDGAASPALNFLFSGALVMRKGVDLLARAFVRLAGEFPHVRLTLMGSGGEESALRSLLAPLGDRVTFAGFVDWDQLPHMYHAAHVLCVPSRHDGWGLVVPEGLAAGLLVIGTDRTGAAREFIRPGQNGWLVQAGNEEALHAAMREAVLLSATDRARYSACARASVADHSLALGAQRFANAVQGTLIP